MSQQITRTLRVACATLLLASAPATATAAAPSNDGTSTALASLSRSPEPAPDAVTEHVASILKTRHDTAKNAVGNIR